MQTLFKSNLFPKSSSKVGAKNFLSGGKKLGSSIVGAAKNNIINFSKTAQAMVPQKKEENENSFIKNYTKQLVYNQIFVLLHSDYYPIIAPIKLYKNS